MKYTPLKHIVLIDIKLGNSIVCLYSASSIRLPLSSQTLHQIIHDERSLSSFLLYDLIQLKKAKPRKKVPK